MSPVLRGISNLAKVVIVILASFGTIFVIISIVFIVQTLTPGDTFVFENFEITISDDTQIHEDDPTDSTYVIKLPITLTNKSRETFAFSWHKMTVYGPEGAALKRIYSMFRHDDDNIEYHSKDICGGGTNSGMYIYFPYDGDGDYYITFNT